MNSLNSILLEGNVTRAPDAKSTAKGTTVCNFGVASNRYFHLGDAMQKETSFFEVETWSGLAEKCSTELTKGRGVRVVGRLKQERWVDAEGKKRSIIKIVAEHVEFKPQAGEAGGVEQSEESLQEEDVILV